MISQALNLRIAGFLVATILLALPVHGQCEEVGSQTQMDITVLIQCLGEQEKSFYKDLAIRRSVVVRVHARGKNLSLFLFCSWAIGNESSQD